MVSFVQLVVAFFLFNAFLRLTLRLRKESLGAYVLSVGLRDFTCALRFGNYRLVSSSS